MATHMNIWEPDTCGVVPPCRIKFSFDDSLRPGDANFGRELFEEVLQACVVHAALGGSGKHRDDSDAQPGATLMRDLRVRYENTVKNDVLREAAIALGVDISPGTDAAKLTALEAFASTHKAEFEIGDAMKNGTRPVYLTTDRTGAKKTDLTATLVAKYGDRVVVR